MIRQFTSLDRFTTIECEVQRPDRYRELLNLPNGRRAIARGAGLSYVAASFSRESVSIDMTRFDRILQFDECAGLIEVEAGISLGKLFNFLFPKRLMVAVQPGHPQITIGGCIAGNVHGKNQYREGLFSTIVEQVSLFHPDYGVIVASRSENSEIFDLTCGGFGLTGLILTARIRLSRCPGNMIDVRRVPTDGFSETFSAIRRLRDDADLLYAWIDLAAKGDAKGRGFAVVGCFAESADSPVSVTEYRALDPSDSNRLRIDALTRRSIPLINWLYRRAALRSEATQKAPLFEFLFPAVSNWFYFDMYGRRGFIESQILVPEHKVDAYLDAFGTLLEKFDRPVILATIKAFKGCQRLLNYNGTGFSFTLDCRNDPEGLAFLAQLDDVNTRHGAITNLLKDSRISASVARQQFPELESFRDRLGQFDPRRRFSSDLSNRLKL